MKERNFFYCVICLFVLFIISSFGVFASAVENSDSSNTFTSVKDVDLFNISLREAKSYLKSISDENVDDLHVILGICDSSLAIDKSISKRIAVLDAKNQLSEYIYNSFLSEDNVAKVTEKTLESNKTLDDDSINQASSFSDDRAIKYFIGNFTTSQFSSFSVEKVQYKDANDPTNMPYVESVALCTVSQKFVDDIKDQVAVALQNDKIIGTDALQLHKSWLKQAEKITSDKIFKVMKSFFKREN